LEDGLVLRLVMMQKIRACLVRVKFMYNYIDMAYFVCSSDRRPTKTMPLLKRPETTGARRHSGRLATLLTS
jgi:hypothetical protein